MPSARHLALATVLAAIAVACIAPSTASAVCVPTSYSWTSVVPTSNWTDTTKWTPSGGYPGCAPGDSAQQGLSGVTIVVDAPILNPLVSLNFVCSSCQLRIATGSSIGFAGPATIPDGALDIDVGGTLTVANGGSLTMGGATTTIPLDGTLDVQTGGTTSTLRLSGTGTLNVDGTAQLSGNSAIGGLTGSGTVTETTATLDVGGPSTFSGSYQNGSGNAALKKSGTGLLTLSGANTYTGATTVSGGGLAVNGSTTSNTTVQSGAVLTGGGTLSGTLTADSGALIGPGDVGVGTLSTGSATLAAGSTFGIELDTASADKLAVTGSVDLGGATLAVLLTGGYVHAPDTVFTIVSNDDNDAVSQTFDSLNEASSTTIGGHLFKVSYAGGDGNDVTLTADGGTPSLTSAPSSDVVLGAVVHNTATLASGTGPTGAITFDLYGPGAATCTGTPAFTDTSTVSGNGDYLSDDFTPTSAGTYRWKAAYAGDQDNRSAAASCSGPVTVAKKTPGLAGAPSAGVGIGGALHDVGTLSGGAGPTGTITFRLFGPGDATCAGTPVFTTAIPVTGNAAHDSGNFTPGTAGTYRWTSSYSGDADNDIADSVCSAPVTVAKAGPGLAGSAPAGVTLGDAVHDGATLSGGFGPTGTITFRLFGPDDATCSGTPAFTSAIPVTGNAVYDSGNFTPSATGTYRWTASYSGDANNVVAQIACNDSGQAVVVSQAPVPPVTTPTTPTTPTTTTTVEPPPVVTPAKARPALSAMSSALVAVGGVVREAGTLSGGNAPTGSITFRLYAPRDADCSGTPVLTDVVTVSGNGDYTSKPFATVRTGAYRWTATYSGDGNNEAAAVACDAPNGRSGVGYRFARVSPEPDARVRPGEPVDVAVRLRDAAGHRISTFRTHVLSQACVVRIRVSGLPGSTCATYRRRAMLGGRVRLGRALAAGSHSVSLDVFVYGETVAQGVPLGAIVVG